ncbi:MAG: prenyltransferase/squalene oxidase repeat-containing protein [Planctomycetota bacterium]
MRWISDHHLDEGGFNETIQRLVRGSPWWMLSIGAHAMLLFCLWMIPMELATGEKEHIIQASLQEKVEEPDEDELLDEQEPDVPEETVFEPVVPQEEEVKAETDVDLPNEDTSGVDGPNNGPLAGVFTNAVIGLGNGGGGGRPGGGGNKDTTPGGSTGMTQNAVEIALQWLADHQDVDTSGGWDCDDFAKHDPADDKCSGAGKPHYDTGVTGLALLAFLGAGYTDRGNAHQNKFARNVRMGLRYLMSVQDDEGCFGARASQHFMYNHAIAALAMCEAYWMTRKPAYKKPAQDGLNFIAMSRNPYMAWRYEPRGGENDTSVTGWMVMTLKSGVFAGLDIDPDAFEGARQWVDKMTDPEFGQVGYLQAGGSPARPEGLQDKFPAEKSQSMTAAGILTRIFLGENPQKSELIQKGAALCAEQPPVWNPDDGSIDMYYWYYATLAMFQVGGPSWRKWNAHMKEAIVNHQHPKNAGSKKGSWDPIGPWGPDGGRVYSTAVLAMCLEVYYRYDKVIGIR